MDYKVITNINNTNPLYKDLFARAYLAIENSSIEGHKIHDDCIDPDKTFRTIEQYFAHLQFLCEIDPAFLLIPLEEPAFEINANTRKIKAPQITTVQTDHLAEMVVFTIDRYFDYMDLASEGMYVYVQWTLPSGKNSASHVTDYVDTTVPGKIRIGWPLQKEITNEVGDVHYSVRFLKFKNNTPDVNNQDSIIYAFNTLPEKFTVSKALSVNEITNVYDPHNESLFRRIIKNSQTTNNGQIPATPFFGEPGTDLQKDGEIEYGLIAQAVTTDNGLIEYTWHFTPAQDSEDGEFKAGIRYPYAEFVELGFVQDNEALRPTTLKKDDKLDNLTNYYRANGDLYTSPTNTLEEDIVLYEKYTTLKPTDENKNIVGKYQVRAINKGASTDKQSREAWSEPYTLVGPSTVSFVTNLPETYMMTDTDNELSVAISSQPEDAQITYEWEYNGISDEDADFIPVLEATNENKLTVSETGWYRVKVTAALNRADDDEISAICKVINMPIKPEITYGENAQQHPIDEKGICVYNTVGLTEPTITLDVKVSDEKFTEFNKGTITYVWSVTSDEDSDLKQIDTFVVAEDGLSSTLTVDNPVGSDMVYNYYCYAINELGGKQEVSEKLQFRVL